MMKMLTAKELGLSWSTVRSDVIKAAGWVKQNPHNVIMHSVLGAVAVTSLGLSIYAVVKINEDNKKESN